MHIIPLPYRIVSLLSWSSHSVGFVLDPSIVVFVPASPPGYCSNSIEEYDITEMVIYRSKPCIPGTHQDKTSFGPCMICPPQSKNNGSSGVVCDKCSLANTSLCFLGAINEINMTSLISYDQTHPYPESPESTQFDDILLQNIFKLPDATVHCLFISPVFWACFTITICLIVFIMIKLVLYRSRYKNRSVLLKKVFAHIDVITEGQFWLGGLISLSLFVLIIFACKFSISFASLYPIEETTTNERMSVSCDGILFNAKFSSSLQLISTRKQNEKAVFALLDKQTITLTVEFVSTAFTCNDSSIQQNRGHGLSIPPTNLNCFANNSILNISTFLPQHVITMQYNVIGPHFVGGLRICFSAPSIITDNDKYTAQQMDY
jgi:hypothetical protein